MYLPPHFNIEALTDQHDLIIERPLGLLISHMDGLEANPVPFLLDRDVAPYGRLRCHLARSNPQMAHFAAPREVLVVFSGLEHYISPSYYPSKRAHGKVVPTWNYIQVQVSGVAHLRDDPAWIGAQIEALTRQHEEKRAQPWAVGDAPEPFIAAQIRAIVGVDIEITKIAGKWKLSQNRTAEDQAGVKAGLGAEADAAAMAMAAMIPVAPKS